MLTSLAKWFNRSMITGAVLTLLAVFAPGWVTGTGDAKKATATAMKAAVVETATPFCVASATADLQYLARAEELGKAKTPSAGATLVSGFGWATAPGSDKPNDDVAKACAKAILAAVPKV